MGIMDTLAGRQQAVSTEHAGEIRTGPRSTRELVFIIAAGVFVGQLALAVLGALVLAMVGRI